MKKEERSLFGRDIRKSQRQTTRDGRLYIKTKQRMSQPKDLTKNLVCISIDHSILSQDFQ